MALADTFHNKYNMLNLLYMDYQIIASIITAGTAISIAVVSFFLNENAKRKADWQQKKFGHYQKLLLAIDDLAVDGRNKQKANQNFSTASNTTVLIASQEVITALMLFHNEIKWENKEGFSRQRHDRLLKELVLAIRKDIGLSKKDNIKSFDFHLIGTSPK
jgi:ATP-dependent Lon protease